MNPKDLVTKQLLKALKYIDKEEITNEDRLKKHLRVSPDSCRKILNVLVCIKFVYCFTNEDEFIDYIPDGKPFVFGLTLIGKKYLEDHFRNTWLTVTPVVASIAAVIVSVVALFLAA